MHEVVGHRRRVVAAQRTGLGRGGVRRADRRARRGDHAFALEHERERRPRRDEVDELSEERLRLVLGVVLLREVAVDDEQARGAQPEATPLEAGLASTLAWYKEAGWLAY